MNKLELLAPAGNMERLQTAFYFGADACYFAGKRFGLRAFADNFKDDELVESVKYIHSQGKKAYITVNIIAHNPDFNGLKEYVEFLQEIEVDGVIVADVGVMLFIKQYAPKLKIHVSTQANITNKYSAKFYADLGATRLILARELSLDEIKEIREFLPSSVELECFVQGSMCISYSGRCLLSNYLTGRDSNRGACAQICRWNFAITPKNNNSTEQYDIEQDERGTYILNSKDLKMIEHLNDLARIGVTAVKIEGRMKSPYYVATVVNAYRRAIDYLSGLNSYADYQPKQEWIDDLEKCSHRPYTTGFYYGSEDKEELSSSSPKQNSIFMGIVKESLGNGKYVIEQRNRFELGTEMEILAPTDSYNKKFKIESMTDSDGVSVTVADKVQQLLTIPCPYILQPGDILRTVSNQMHEDL